MSSETQYRIMASGTAPELFPSETFFCLLYYGQDAIEIPKQYPFHHGWGAIADYTVLNRETYPMPTRIDMVWLSVIEQQFYSLESELSVKLMQELWEQNEFEHILVGMAPYGLTALWFVGDKKSILINCLKAEPIEVGMNYFLPSNPDYKLTDYCQVYIQDDEAVRENLEVNGLPARDLFDRYMQQFCYRYLVMFQQWNEDDEQWEKPELDEEGQPIDGMPLPEFDFIEEALWDGTHDKLHDGGLLNYHKAGKPKKLAIRWHIKKSQYTAYLWFEDEVIRSAFERFYGAHRDTKVDFIIRIDAEKKKYELALYRYGLKEPVVIGEDAYQMIVFKNKFEHYRSENYDQPRGAWIW